MGDGVERGDDDSSLVLPQLLVEFVLNLLQVVE